MKLVSFASFSLLQDEDGGVDEKAKPLTDKPEEMPENLDLPDDFSLEDVDGDQEDGESKGKGLHPLHGVPLAKCCSNVPFSLQSSQPPKNAAPKNAVP